jgi:hypothetical protein
MLPTASCLGKAARMLPFARAAARNNAEWCDLVCRSHGLGTKWEKSAWKSQRRSPRFYPDAVSLDTSVTAADLLEGIDRSAGCSVKDSFASLDLTPEGFRILFEATWIQRPPTPPQSLDNGLVWRIVRTADELRMWAAAHGGGEVFRPELPAQPEIAFLGAYDSAGTLAGGAIAHRGQDVAGVGNVFACDHDPRAIWASVSGAVTDNYPDLPIVGYESGTNLELALRAGFEESGSLRVWLRD